MGSGKVNMVVFLMVMGVAALQLHTSTAQTTHVVLDSSGWSIPQTGAAAYTAWASTKTFTVGDTLVFNFPANVHTVAEVRKPAFDACTTTATLSQWTTPPARVTLKSPGEHYYLCTIIGHCTLGQKLAINVTAAPSTPPPAPTPSPSATPPPAAASTPPPAPTPSPPATPPPAAAPSPVATPPPAAAPSPVATPTPAASGPSSPSATPPAPSSGATPPAPGSNTTPSSPSPASVTAPPPPKSAASFAAAALPVTFLSVVIALFY